MVQSAALKLLRRLLGALLVLGELPACSAPRMPAATAAPKALPLSRPTPLYVGLGIADVTPPPGVATFGYALDARVAAGYWTRLNCRAFVFLSETDERPLALVPCELAAVSTLLQRRVVQILRDNGVDIPPQRLFLSAVHTHAGPAHYFDAEFYGGMASSHAPGFDPAVLEMIAGRIAQAAQSAYLAARQAQTSSPPRPAKLRWLHGEHWGLTRNRSLAAFMQNKGRDDTPKPRDDIAGSLDPSARAIDPKLDILEIAEDRGNGGTRTLGWIGLFAMHPTVMPTENRYFGGDAFGVASRLIEQELRRDAAAHGDETSRPLVGLINTNEGDLVPRWSSGDRGETITIGKRLAEAFIDVHTGQNGVPFQSQVALASSYLEVSLPGNDFGLGQGEHLCDRAELGLAAIYGASDHPSSIAQLAELTGPMGDPARKDCQAPKRPALGLFQRLVAGKHAFPTTIPLGLLRLDDTIIGFVPAEVTTMTGRRIRGAISKAYDSVVDARPITSRIGGLTNGYIEYVATHEEYSLQRYEGGSTLYGPMTERFLVAVFGNLARRMQLGASVAAPPGTRPEVAGDFEYGVGPKRARLPTEPQTPVVPRSIELCRVAAIDEAAPPSFCFAFEAGHPDLHALPPSRTTSLVAVKDPWKPLQWRVRLAGSRIDPSVADPILREGPQMLGDDGFEFVTAVHERTTRGWLWTTLFTPTSDEWDQLRDVATEFAFSVGGTSGAGVLRSESFTFAQTSRTPTQCTIELARKCGAFE